MPRHEPTRRAGAGEFVSELLWHAAPCVASRPDKFEPASESGGCHWGDKENKVQRPVTHVVEVIISR